VVEDDPPATIPDALPAGVAGIDDRAIAPGTEIGGYVVDEELGRGGMGVVYRATHPLIGKRAAIKVLRPSLSKNPATVERFVQEARAVNQIGHPGIVDIFAFGALPDGRSYLVMDLLEGESLRARVKRGALPAGEACAVLDEVASALAVAHDKGFIHRDLKPDNVFLATHPGRTDVKLLDFGLAKLMTPAGSPRVYRTATGAQLGTPEYMSPEQLRGTGVDHRTDIYALGVVALEILTGRRARRYGDGTFELGGKSLGDLLREIPDMSGELAQLVEAMLAPDAELRPSLAAIRAVLKRARAALPQPADTSVSLPASVDAMTPSQLGARPVLPTPIGGNPTAPPPVVQPAAVSAGLRAAGAHGATKLGVPPPPMRAGAPSQVHSRASERPPASEQRWWLLAGLGLVLAGVAALVVVLLG
jgi:serine/threonine protein kinase